MAAAPTARQWGSVEEGFSYYSRHQGAERYLGRGGHEQASGPWDGIPEAPAQASKGDGTAIPTIPYLAVGLLLVMVTLAWAVVGVMSTTDSLMQDRGLFSAGIAVLALGVVAPTALAVVTAVRAGMHGAPASYAIPVSAGKAALVMLCTLAVWTACALFLA